MRNACMLISAIVLVFLLAINDVNFMRINLKKSVSTSLVECISFAEDKQGVYCLFVVFCFLLSFR